MSEVAPFGDVPDKLSAPLKRSFVASRTYVQALKIASDILANINKVRFTP
jgi:glypican 4 (K-glypican)